MLKDLFQRFDVTCFYCFYDTPAEFSSLFVILSSFEFEILIYGILLFLREKEKHRQRDDAWNKINSLAQDNPQVSYT